VYTISSGHQSRWREWILLICRAKKLNCREKEMEIVKIFKCIDKIEWNSSTNAAENIGLQGLKNHFACARDYSRGRD